MSGIFVVSPTSAVQILFQGVATHHGLSYAQCDDADQFVSPAEPYTLMAWECYPKNLDIYFRLIPHTRRLIWLYDTERYPPNERMGSEPPIMSINFIDMQNCWRDPIEVSGTISHILVNHLGLPKPVVS